MKPIIKKHLGIFVYVLLVFIILVHQSGVALNNELDYLHFDAPKFLVERVEFEIISRIPVSRDDFGYEIIYTIINLLGVIWILTFILIQNLKGITYEYQHISRLLIRLKGLLLPKQNTSKFKVPLLFS